MYVSRSDVYARSEHGGDWFDEFLRNYDVNKKAYPTSIQEIMGIITDKRGETVESVVKKYREQVGLDLVTSSEEEEDNVKMASCSKRPLSIRYAEEKKSIVEAIESNKGLKMAIESLCKHSGGHKPIQSLIGFIRKEIGNDVSYSDDQLEQYLMDMKSKYQTYQGEANDGSYVGLVGLDNNNHIYDDNTADYMNNATTK